MARHRLAFVPLVVLAALVAFFDGCTIMNGLTVPDDGDGGLLDEAGAPDADTCNHAYPPADPPSISDFGAIESVTAVRNIDLGVDGGAASANDPFFGFDLDGKCTCPDEPTCVAKLKTCDDEQGRDNALVRLVRGLANRDINVQAAVTDDLEKGANGVILIIEGYNGEPNDSRVDVVLVSSAGNRTVLPDGGLSQKIKPTFTREDKWLLDADQFIAKDAGEIISAVNRQPGYVRDGKLVVRLSSGELRLGDEGLVIQLVDGYLVGDLVQDTDGSFYVSQGEIGGRWGIRGGLLGARQVRPSEELQRLCHPLMRGFFEAVRDEMCKAVDIMAVTRDDNLGKDCDAISVSLKFAGAPGGLGPIYRRVMTDECPPADEEDTKCPP